MRKVSLISAVLVIVLLVAGQVAQGASGRAPLATPPGQDLLLVDGRLFRTPDSGLSWLELTPAGWKLLAIQELDGGVLLGLAAAERPGSPGLFDLALATNPDGGLSWSFQPLPGAPQPWQAEFSQPAAAQMAFPDAQNGAIFLQRPSSSNFTVGTRLETSDGGASWTLSEVAEGGELELLGASALPGETYQPAWRVVSGGSCAEKAGCQAQPELQRSLDGGLSWQAQPFPAGLPLEDFAQPVSPEPEALDLAAVGHGFDKCEIPSLASMQEWWTESPYSAVNLYIGGSMRACSNAALSASYLSSLDAQGWTLIPTWVGPQAACSSYKTKIPYDTQAAFNLGITEADAAANVAANLKLWGQVLYYDLEAFDTANAPCLASAKAFIDGWSFQLHARGYTAGVYGSPCTSGLPDYWALENRPEAIWIAAWIYTAYNPNATVWTTACGLSNSTWSNHQRLRQYAGGHNETWGSVTLNIDSNVMDGIVATAYGQPDAICPRPDGVAPSGVILYSGADYDCHGRQAEYGYYWRNAAGLYNLDGFFENRGSSIYLPAGVSVRLFENLNGGGGSLCLEASEPLFGGKSFNNGQGLDNQVSSFEIFTGPACGDVAPDASTAQDITPPVVKFTSHVKGGYLNAATTSPVTIQASLQDSESGPSHAQFFVGYGNPWSWRALGWDLDGSDGWSASWSPSAIADQTEVAFYVFAWDQAGNGAGSPLLHLTLDRVAPSSALAGLPASLNSTAIHLAWSGSDSLSGMASYDLQMQTGGGAWTDVLVGTTLTQTTVIGQLGESYAFRLRGRDKAGNLEAYPAGAETSTLINLCSGDAYEPDDALAEATTLELNLAQTHTICGAGDADWLAFTVQAGQAYQFSTGQLGADTDTWLGLYDGGGNLLAENDDNGSSLASALFYQAESAGTLYLKVQHTDPRLAGSAVSYSIRAELVQLRWLPNVR